LLDDPSLPHGRLGPEDRHLKIYELWDNLLIVVVGTLVTATTGLPVALGTLVTVTIVAAIATYWVMPWITQRTTPLALPR
jgi:antibiotic biosynthesis monooxygenase (ABM) superfamily enzyme